MAAEPKQVASAEFWTRWENQVVNGVFPLRRLLGCSDRSAVFLTEHKAQKLPDAAIKLVRTDGLGAKAQLKHWKAAAALSHPHLVRLFEMGRWQPGRREFVFVVMEYAEQRLDQILTRRALGADEVREILPPTLDALAFLHRNQRVHGHLKPSNLLAIGDQLKLTSDNIRPAGRSTSGVVRISWYDPPELNERGATPAGDVWSLGMTLVEALTRDTPAWPNQRSDTASLPASLPASFGGLVRRCLNRNPDQRPTVIELEAPFKSALRANSTADSEPFADLASQEATPLRSHRKRNLALLALAAALLVSSAVWVRFSDTSQTQPRAALDSAARSDLRAVAPAVLPPAPEPEPPAPVAAAPAEPIVAPEATPSLVLQEIKPNVPQATLDRIQRRIVTTVRVLVDPAGDVVATLMENPGSSSNLARLADAAAREWKFVETEQPGARVWLLRFEFTREGVTAQATEQ